MKFFSSKEFLNYFDKPESIVVWNLEGYFESKEVLRQKIEAVLGGSIRLDIRYFDFTLYPPHVRNLKNFAWKIIINTRMIAEFGAIWYFDTSIAVIEDPTKFQNLANMTKLAIHDRQSCYQFNAPGSHTSYRGQ